MKSALITGITGQDGAYLAKFLLGKGYKVFGGYRRLSTPNFWRLYDLGIHDKVELLPLDILDSRSISEALISSTPNEVYHLAAQSFVGASFVQPLYTSEVTGLGSVRLLDEILKFNKKIKVYQASSSEMFGEDNSPKKMKNLHSNQLVHMQFLNYTVTGWYVHIGKGMACMQQMEFYSIMNHHCVD